MVQVHVFTKCYFLRLFIVHHICLSLIKSFMADMANISKFCVNKGDMEDLLGGSW
jgi:hypothetical protein